MTLDQIIAYCESLRGAEAIIKIDHHLTYNIGGKSFLWLSQDQIPITCDFKCTEEDFGFLSEHEGFRPAPYMARNHWIQCINIGDLKRQDMQIYISRSYTLIKSKLSKKMQKSLSQNSK
ncbi:MAG: MmcQ/YjbR family DNA-binding protein [Saprospiraceae bacterium]|nr:MmcQ/YjbR family DNA-binding protein [Saprospiraceae bacterium]